MDNGRTKSEILNQEDWQRSLEISAPTSMPTPETLQEKANEFFTPENTVGNFPDSPEAAEERPTTESQPLENQPLENQVNPSELGRITPVFTPNQSNTPEASERRNFNSINIRTTGDHLEKSTIPEIDSAIDELSQTGNLSNFYDEIRGEGSMLDANLNNSFNRKLGDDQLGGGA